jgi:hypothetical protein
MKKKMRRVEVHVRLILVIAICVYSQMQFGVTNTCRVVASLKRGSKPGKESKHTRISRSRSLCTPVQSSSGIATLRMFGTYVDVISSN